jgi:hypothetical protein
MGASSLFKDLPRFDLFLDICQQVLNLTQIDIFFGICARSIKDFYYVSFLDAVV